jgi:histone acetyltransferase (RNA polymerase elongator complex component)
VKHANIPVFVPHLGCPNDCVFCNQRKITGKDSFSIEDARSSIQKIASSLGDASQNAEIAFFGGSFTAIPTEKQIFYLEAVQEFIGEGKFAGIRISTRPDCITEENLALLKRYHVRNVELGAQSMDDSVLLANQKRMKGAMKLINVCELVMEVFEMTGFADILVIE